MATEGAGGEDEQMDWWTTNESPGNKKADERSDKRVNRTKDGESRKDEWPDQLERTTRRTRMHTFAAAEGGGGA